MGNWHPNISYNFVTNASRNNHKNTILKCKHVLIPIYDFRFPIVNFLFIRKILVSKYMQANKKVWLLPCFLTQHHVEFFWDFSLDWKVTRYDPSLLCVNFVIFEALAAKPGSVMLQIIMCQNATAALVSLVSCYQHFQ